MLFRSHEYGHWVTIARLHGSRHFLSSIAANESETEPLAVLDVVIHDTSRSRFFFRWRESQSTRMILVPSFAVVVFSLTKLHLVCESDSVVVSIELHFACARGVLLDLSWRPSC